MRIFDITVAISNTVPIYEGDPKAEVRSVLSIASGAPANVSRLCFGAHTATHVDAPNHFIKGARRLDELDLSKLIGPCTVIEIADDVLAIGPEHLGASVRSGRLLFKTRNSAFWETPEKGFRTDFTYIRPEAASILADAGVKLVGIDYLSVERFDSVDFAAHIVLLEKEVVILEGLDLRAVPPGEYELICLPLKYIGGHGDGAPARTILREI